MTVELWDLTGKKLLASTIADANGDYTLEVGKALARMDGDATNAYGNNIKFADADKLAAREPEYYDLPDSNLANDGDNVAVRVWSDGMDPLGTTATTRPQFETPTGVLASVPEVTKTEVADATQLTDAEKQQIKDAVTSSGLPGDGGTVTVRDDGSAIVTDTDGNTYTIPSQDLITEKSKTPDAAELTVPEKVVTGDSVTDATVKATKDGEPFPGGVVYAKLPGQDELVKVTVGEEGTATLPQFTPTAEDNKVILYPENSTDSKPLDTKTITLGTGEPVAGDGKSAVGDPSATTVPVSDGTTDEGKTSFTVTLKDKNGNPVIGVADTIDVSRTDGGALNKPEIKDNGDGTYTVTVSSEKSGSSPLEVKAGGTVIGQTQAVTFEPGEVDLSKSTAKVTRDGVAKRQPGRNESNQVTVTMKDQFGNPTDKGVTADDLALTGTEEGFEVTPAKREGATGVYDLTVTSADSGTFENIQTTLGGENIGDPVTMVFVEPPADPAQSTLTVDTAACDKAVADGKDTCPVTITLKDGNGDQIKDPKRVPALGLTGTAKDGTTATFSDITFDEETGTYTANMTATKADTYTITATSGGQPIATDADAPTATFVPGPVAKASNWQNLPGTDNPLAAGTPVSGVTVTLTDANDNELEPGTVVYMNVPCVKDPVKATVGENGVATLEEFTPTASTVGDGATKPGATITMTPAKADGSAPADDAQPVDTKQTIGVTAGAPSAANTTATIADGDNNKTVDEPVTVTVTLKDANGNLVTDREQAKNVTVKAADTDGNEITGGELKPVDGKPGVYTSDLNADKPGDYTVTTTVGNDEAKDKPTATFAVGQPAQAEIAGLDPVAVDEKSSAVTVTVKDKAGNPIPNATVAVEIGDADPVEVTVGDDGTVTLDGQGGRPGPISMTATDAQAGGVPIAVYPAKDAATAIGSDTLPAKASTPEDVKATQQPSGDVVITATVPNAAPGQKVTVYAPDADGTSQPVGIGTVYPDGTVKVTVDAADIGDASAVTLTSGSGPAESDPTDRVAVTPVKKLDAPTDVTAVTPTGSSTTTVAGKSAAPADTEVTVHYTNADGTEGSKTGLVHKDGTFQVQIPAQEAGQTVSVSVGFGKAQSDRTDAAVKAQTPTPTDVTALTKTDGSTVVSGTAEPGSTVTVTDKDGKTLGEATADPRTGAFTIPVAAGIPAGTEIDVTASSDGKVDSEPAYPVTRLTQLDTPTVTALTSPDGKTTAVTGKATPGQKVTVTAGGKTYTPEVKADGSYSFTTDGPLANGTELTAVAGEGLTASETGKGTANTQTATPTAKAVTSEDGKTTTVSGKAEPGAKVTVTGPDGTEKTVTAREDGSYSVDLTPALKDGETVKVTAQNGTEVPSEPTTATAGTRLPAPTDVTAVTSPDGKTTTVTGTSTAPKDTPVEVTYTGTDGKQHTATGTVGEDGTIEVKLANPPAQDGSPVTVTVGDGDTKSTPAEGVTAQTKTATPTVDSVVTDPAGTTDPKTTVSGTAKPGAKVTVKAGDKVVGETTANEDGSYSVPVSPALQDKTQVSVTATGKDKVTSDPATGAAVTKVGTPTVTGTAEPGSTVTVTGPDGKTHTATAGEDGTYSVTIEPALTDGETVTVTATKDGKTGSDAATGTAATQVATPTDVATTTDPATGATTVTGKSDAKPGTTVTITDKAGNVVGTGTVKEDGTFSIPTDPAQPGGTELNVTIGDKPVTSGAATVTVKYPAATDGVAIADPAAGTTKVDGKATGVADDTPVTVRNAKGEVIGTGEVKDGTFTVIAKPALPNGAVITVTIGTPNTSAASEPTLVTVQAIPVKPGDVDATVTEDGKGVTVTGKTDAGNGVTVVDKDGGIHQDVADKDGSFAVTVPGAKAGDQLTVRVVRDGLVSEAVTVTAHAADKGTDGSSSTGSGRASTASTVKRLARTGANALMVLSAGGILLIGGGLVLAAARRRKED